jgi:hypothetical protein
MLQQTLLVFASGHCVAGKLGDLVQALLECGRSRTPRRAQAVTQGPSGYGNPYRAFRVRGNCCGD